MMPVDQPPALIAPAGVRYAVCLYGDQDALIEVKKDVDARVAVTGWFKLGATNTLVLFIAATGSKPTESEQSFINDVNRKKFGNLTAGFATVGPAK